MRCLGGSLLTVLALLAGGTAVRADRRAQPDDLPESVKGKGETPEAAMRAALDEARGAFEQYLNARYPEIQARPTVEFLRRTHLVERVAEPYLAQDQGRFEVLYRLRRPQESQLDELRERSRLPYMAPRHRQAAVVLGGLVLVLLVLAAYLRLDEATHGYYAGRLFGAAAVLVAVVAYLVWSLL